MSTAVALKPVLPIFQALGWRITQIPLRFWTSIADKGRFWTQNADVFSAQLAAWRDFGHVLCGCQLTVSIYQLMMSVIGFRRAD
jgi:hypothetical protein